MVMGLTTGLWVSAQVRLCDRAFIPAAVVRRGDPDAGTVLLKLNRFEAGVTVYTQASTMSDEPAWSRGTGPNPVPEADADAYIARQVARDPDVWVLEIEDRKGAVQARRQGRLRRTTSLQAKLSARLPETLCNPRWSLPQIAA